MKNSSTFFNNRECEYFPCHEGVAEDSFNCLFCYCPLYHLGEDCGGDYVMKNGVKSCVNCSRPHDPDHFQEIREKLKETFHKG